MSPAVKYTLGRFGLFVLILVLMLPLPLNFLVKAMIALILSAALSYFLLADWRNQMAEQLGTVASRRAQEKERLRAALAGDEDAAAAGDRAADPTTSDRAAAPATPDHAAPGDRTAAQATTDRATAPATTEADQK